MHTHTTGKGKIVFHPNSSNLEESYEGEWSEDVIHGRGTYKYRREEGEQSLHLPMHACMDEWIDRWIDGCTDEWIDG
jgi:hypothetical protein